MEDDKYRYAIGQQDFKTLRLDDALYVDKTQYVEKIVKGKSKYYFLARPRRFGKSLFLSTMRYFFEGQRDLFKGLHIYSFNWDWEKHPVLYLDLNTGDYTEPSKLESTFESNLRRWEEKFGIERKDDSYPERFKTILESVHKQTGKQAIILVDEYDKPLVKNLNKENFEAYREKLAALYSNFKTCADDIRLVFMTGVSRFSKLSVFSGLNNLKDITFSDEFADICGISEKELQDNFQTGINALAKKYDITFENACAQLKRNYDGYRFADTGSDIYNPWSLLNCLNDRKIANYWNSTGIPTIIAETLHGIDADLEDVLNTECSQRHLLGLDLRNADPLALLYQTGYITIKDYDRENDSFLLGVPNLEVRQGLFDVLLPYYVKVKRGTATDTVFRLTKAVRTGNAEEFMKCLQAYFAGIPYELQMDNENNFHNAFYILMTMLNFDVTAEASTSDGRIDLLLKSAKFIYIIELKYDGTARAALNQINDKKYDMQFHGETRRLIKIGVNFSSKTRRIEDWLIEQ